MPHILFDLDVDVSVDERVAGLMSRVVSGATRPLAVGREQSNGSGHEPIKWLQMVSAGQHSVVRAHVLIKRFTGDAIWNALERCAFISRQKLRSVVWLTECNRRASSGNGFKLTDGPAKWTRHSAQLSRRLSRVAHLNPITGIHSLTVTFISLPLALTRFKLSTF